MDLAVANPDLTVMTRAGDRFGGGRPWRFGAEQSAGVTRAALDEAITAAERAVETRDVAHGAVDRARAAVHERRDVERRAEEAARHARSVHDRAQAASERLASERADRAEELEVTGGSRVGAGRGARRRAGAHRRARGAGARAGRGRGASAQARAPELAAAEAEAERRTAARAAALADLDAREVEVRRIRREHSVRVAAHRRAAHAAHPPARRGRDPPRP